MTKQFVQEQLSVAYVRAVAANAGIAYSTYGQDFGIDGKFNEIEYDEENRRHYQTGYGIDFQLKASTNVKLKNGVITYDLEVKNYRDLIKTNVGFPRVLILYAMPKQRDEWLTVSDEELILKKCAWWVSLKGEPETSNTTKVRIRIPENQKLSVDELKRLIDIVKEGDEL